MAAANIKFQLFVETALGIKSTGEPRAVTLHRNVRASLHRLWMAADSPKEGRAFVNRFGRP